MHREMLSRTPDVTIFLAEGEARPRFSHCDHPPPARDAPEFRPDRSLRSIKSPSNPQRDDEDVGHALFEAVREDSADEVSAYRIMFTNQEGGVQAAARAVEAALGAAGFTVQREDQAAELADIFPDMGQGMAEWTVTSPAGEQMVLQLAYFDRSSDPVPTDIGPMQASDTTSPW